MQQQQPKHEPTLEQLDLLCEGSLLLNQSHGAANRAASCLRHLSIRVELGDAFASAEVVDVAGRVVGLLDELHETMVTFNGELAKLAELAGQPHPAEVSP